MFMFSTVNKQTLLFEKTFSLCYYFFGNFLIQFHLNICRATTTRK